MVMNYFLEIVHLSKSYVILITNHQIKKSPQIIRTDISSFDELISNEAVYVDKTELIYSNFLRDRKKYHFLVRPRRFGKSLLCSTLANIFLGNKKPFRGLWLDGKWDFEKEKCCIIHLDMSSVAGADSIEMFRKVIYSFIDDIARKLSLNVTFDSPPFDRFRKLIYLAHEKSGKPVVVIIDEYDKPILEEIDNPELREKIRKELQSFYSILKSSSSDLRLVFITGLLKFSQTSMFSTLNNLIDHSLRYNAGTLCGFTEHELVSNFDPFIQTLSEEDGVPPDKLITNLKEKYNGYSFGISKSKISETVLNPFQVSCALSFQEDVDDDYWSISGSSQLIANKARETGKLLLGNKSTTTLALRQSSSLDSIPLEILMYYGGYLTITSYDRQTSDVQLRIPNSMIKDVLRTDLLKYIFKSQEIVVAKKALARNISSLMKSAQFSENDATQLEQLFNQLYADVPYDHLTSEAAFRNVLDIIFSLEFTDIRTELHTSKGRSDLVIYCFVNGRLEKIFIIEYKFDKYKDPKISEVAIDQIQEKEYAVAHRIHGVPIYFMGVAYTSERKVSVVVKKDPS
jgi:hypothetical protein